MTNTAKDVLDRRLAAGEITASDYDSLLGKILIGNSAMPDRGRAASDDIEDHGPFGSVHGFRRNKAIADVSIFLFTIASGYAAVTEGAPELAETPWFRDLIGDAGRWATDLFNIPAYWGTGLAAYVLISALGALVALVFGWAISKALLTKQPFGSGVRAMPNREFIEAVDASNRSWFSLTRVHVSTSSGRIATRGTVRGNFIQLIVLATVAMTVLRVAGMF